MPSALAYAAFAAFGAVLLTATVSVLYWVSQDAAARGSSFPAVWAVAALVVPLALPYYLAAYRPSTERSVPPTRGERAAATLAAASLSASLVGAFLAPPDPFTQGIWAFGTLLPLLPAAYVLVYRRGYRRLPVVGSA